MINKDSFKPGRRYEVIAKFTLDNSDELWPDVCVVADSDDDNHGIPYADILSITELLPASEADDLLLITYISGAVDVVRYRGDGTFEGMTAGCSNPEERLKSPDVVSIRNIGKASA